jgi:hypothetical protein
VTGKVAVHGGNGLENMTDVTKQIGITAVNSSYDKATNTLTLDLLATNTSNGSITGPLKLRILDPASAIGDPVILNSENGVARSGAVLTLPVTGGSLASGKHTQRVQLKLRFDGATPIEKPPARNGWGSVFRFSARVYASSVGH